MRIQQSARFHRGKRVSLFFVVLMTLVCVLSTSVFAESEKNEVSGSVYTFDKDSHYAFQDEVLQWC